MLVLSRRRDERLILLDEETGKRIEIVIVEAKKNWVSIGIDAPKEIRVIREELLAKALRTQ